VISVKKGKDAKLSLVLKYDAREQGCTIRTEGELRSYAKEHWYDEWEMDVCCIARFRTWLAEIKAGNEIIVCRASNEDGDCVVVEPDVDELYDTKEEAESVRAQEQMMSPEDYFTVEEVDGEEEE
jgi:hypothetical protein